MPIPPQFITRLHQDHPVAAELPTSELEMKTYLMIFPRVPLQHEQPELWKVCNERDSPFLQGFNLKSRESIGGYELRYLRHHVRYTESDWGFDYDYVLDDLSTRVKRFILPDEDALETAIATWTVEFSDFRDPRAFDSSLVNGPIEYYLNRPKERPHLWFG